MGISGTVFVVDDDPAVRSSLECVMVAAEMQTRTYAGAEEFLADFHPDEPGCLVLDLRMPGMPGQDLLAALRQRRVTTPVIVISGHADVPAVVQSMKLGLVDFLTKPVDPTVLVALVTKALADDTAAHAARANVDAMKQRLAKLSERELEVFRLLVAGLLHKQIAGELNISARTVDHHHANINAKLGTNNVADLVRLGVGAGVV